MEQGFHLPSAPYLPLRQGLLLGNTAPQAALTQQRDWMAAPVIQMDGEHHGVPFAHETPPEHTIKASVISRRAGSATAIANDCTTGIHNHGVSRLLPTSGT